MHNKEFILHLTLIENIGPAIIQKILQRSDVNPSDLYSFSQADWIHTFGFSEATAERLADGLQNKKMLEVELALIEQNDIQWVTFEDEAYPQLLKNIYLPPAVLYWQGASLSAHPECPEGVYRREKKLAIVGARKADNYGQHAIDMLVPGLIAANYTIVSGGARGIDTMAHQATLNHAGKTIAVLGSGLLCPYPFQNIKLFKLIAENGGTVVSSFPLTMEGLPGNFPARNRIITGLSHGCLVVQAAQKSGALISAHYALEQGREVFAVPGPIGNELSAGCNTLIQNGAKLVTCTADILQEFGDRVIVDNRVMQEKVLQLTLESTIIPAKKAAVSAPSTELRKYSHYSSQQKIIITACKKLISFDDIINTTQLSHELVQTELFNLQLDGVISQDFTGMWIQH
jgi:DNA processing protein